MVFARQLTGKYYEFGFRIQNQCCNRIDVPHRFSNNQVAEINSVRIGHPTKGGSYSLEPSIIPPFGEYEHLLLASWALPPVIKKKRLGESIADRGRRTGAFCMECVMGLLC